MTSQGQEQQRNREELFFAGATYLTTLIIFLPIIFWVFQKTKESEQLLHAFIILGFSAVFLIYENQEKIKLSLKHDNLSLTLLLLSFLTVAIKVFVGWPILVLVSFCFAIASIVRFSFGKQASKISTAMLIAFFIFLLLIITMPRVDWPLRHLAGGWSAWLLELMGNGTELLLVTRPEPQLVLTVNELPFIVAPDCNGFGVISASILLSLLLTIYRRVSLVDLGLLVLASVMVAFVSNIVRIIIIVNLAPHVDNYMMMHEIAGTLVFYGALALLWWFIMGFGVKAPSKA